MLAYTQGPWKYRQPPKESDDYTPIKYWIDGRDGVPVADVKDNDRPEANARLIATAPELLYVAKRALDLLREAELGTGETGLATKMAEVIAKAEGRE